MPDQVTVAADRPVEVATVASDLQICFIDVPQASSGSTLASTALPKLGGEDGSELRFPVPHRLVAEDDPALEEHLAEVLEREPVAQAPKHHEGDDVTRILGPVQ
jgi:hypothetical protein